MKKLHWTYSEFDRTYFLSYQIIMINDRKYTENIYNIYTTVGKSVFDDGRSHVQTRLVLAMLT